MTTRVVYGPVFYPEGPFWEAGRLYFVEYARHALRVLDIARCDVATLWQQAGLGPAAVARAPDGALWVTASDGNCLMRIDAHGSAHVAVPHDDAGRSLPAPNDLVFDSAGGLYFTASGVFDPAAPIAGGVFRHGLDGGTRLLASEVHYANGIALAPDGATLFVAEHLRNRVLAFDVGADGSLGSRRVYADLNALAHIDSVSPLVGPDGLACASDGRLVVAQFGAGRLLVLAADAGLERIVALPYRYPTNVAFGATEQMLYVTAFHENSEPYTGALLEVELT